MFPALGIGRSLRWMPRGLMRRGAWLVHAGALPRLVTSAIRPRPVERSAETARAATAGGGQPVPTLLSSQQLDSLGRLTGGVAHDFNNLLTVVLGNAAALRAGAEDRGDARGIARAELIERAAERGSRLAAQLLAFSGKQVLMPRTVSAYDVVSGAYHVLAAAAPETIRIVLTAERNLWQCRVDPAQLESAVLNLVLNARDAMADGGNITIAFRNHKIAGEPAQTPSRKAGHYVSIDVQDTGIGIPAELHSRVFEPFFTTKPIGQGSGLGLAQVHGFARQSGGWVELQSTLGTGTTVGLFLPRFRGSERDGNRGPAGPSPDAQLPTVLVVEPDQSLRNLSRQALSEGGHEVLEASTGSGAITHLVSQASIAVMVVADCLTGGISGIELGRHARQLRPDLKVLVTTGAQQPAAKASFRSTDGKRFDYLEKPYRSADLLAVVAALLAAETFSTETEELLADARVMAFAEARAGNFAAEVAAGPAERNDDQPKQPASVRRSTIRLGVLPFATVGADDRALGVGLSEEVTSAFAGFPMITCIAPASLAAIAGDLRDRADWLEQLDLDYLVEGTLRKKGDDVRVSARLLKMGGAGEIVWTRRFGSKMTDALNLRDRIAREIAAQIEPQVMVWEGREAALRPQVNATAHDLMLRAIPAIYSLDKAGFSEAGVLLERSLALDASSAACHSWLAHWYLLKLGQGWEPDPDQAIERADRLSQRAIALDAEDARGLTVAGHVRAFLRRDAEGALPLHERALALNPSLSLAWCYSGLAHTYLGNHAEAIRSIQRAKELSPHDPHGFFFDAMLMIPFLMVGEYETAVRLGRRACDAHPSFSSTYKSLIPTLGFLGAIEEANIARRTLMGLEPEFCVSRAITRSPFRRAKDLDTYARGLRLAGVPENHSDTSLFSSGAI